MADQDEKDPKVTADAAGTGDPSQNSGDQDLSGLKLDSQQQAHFESVLERRLERAKETWEKKAQADADKAKQAAEDARLAEAQEFQQLAQRRQKTIEDQAEELAVAQEQAKLTEKYAKALEVYRDQLIDGVPEHITSLLKGMDVVDQLNWLTENSETLAPMGEDDKKYVGPPPAPGAKGQNGQMSADEKRQRAWRPKL